MSIKQILIPFDEDTKIRKNKLNITWKEIVIAGIESKEKQQGSKNVSKFK